MAQDRWGSNGGRTQDTLRFLMSGYLLSVNSSAYLVTVRPANGETGLYVHHTDLPEWVFGSKHAIWLLEGQDGILMRAIEGEKIKRQLLNKYLMLRKSSKKSNSVPVPLRFFKAPAQEARS